MNANNSSLWRPGQFRYRFVEAVGANAFIAGVALAGRYMIWMEMFSPGITPIREILNCWLVFLSGGVLLGFPAGITARIFYDFYIDRDERLASNESLCDIRSDASDHVFVNSDLNEGKHTSPRESTLHAIRLPRTNLEWKVPGSSCAD